MATQKLEGRSPEENGKTDTEESTLLWFEEKIDPFYKTIKYSRFLK